MNRLFRILFPDGSRLDAVEGTPTFEAAVSRSFGSAYSYVWTDPHMGNWVVFGTSPRNAFERLPKSVQQHLVFIPF